LIEAKGLWKTVPSSGSNIGVEAPGLECSRAHQRSDTTAASGRS